MKIIKGILSVLISLAVLFSFASCGNKQANETDSLNKRSGVLQEQIDITKNKAEKLFEIPALSSLSDGITYSYTDVPSSLIYVGNRIFYTGENNEFHCFNVENNEDKIVTSNLVNSDEITYSDSYMMFCTDTDGYNHSYHLSHHLYDIKNNDIVSNETVNNLVATMFEGGSGLSFVGLFGDNICYEERSCLKYYNIASGTTTTIYTPAEPRYEKGDYGYDYMAYQETYKGIYAVDTGSSYLYYSIDCDNGNAKNNEWVLFRYDFTGKTNDKIYTAITDSATGGTKGVPSFRKVYAQNGKLYCLGSSQDGGFENELYTIENGKIEKIENALPCESINFIARNSMYYTSNDSNVIVNGEKITVVNSSVNENAGFLGVFNGFCWYSGSEYLETLNESTNELENKILFNGFIIGADNENLYCYGIPIEKYEITDVQGEKNDSYESGEAGCYKVSINDIETRTEYKDVFLVSESDKDDAISIVQETYANEILLYVKSPTIIAREYTYVENVVTVVITGKFSFGNGLWYDDTMRFSVDLTQNKCMVSSSLTWETIKTLNSR